MNFRHILFCSALGLFLSQSCFAEGVSKLPYNTLRISYSKINFDDLPVDADGVNLAGSYDVGSNVFVAASYSTGKTDDFQVLGVDGAVKVTGISAGIGYHFALSEKADLVPQLSALKSKTEGSGNFAAMPAEEDTGYSLGLGLRALVIPQLELSASIDYSDIYDDDSTSFGFNAIFYPIEKIGLGVGYELGDNSDVITVGAGINF